ncbi:MAG: hypothetical protein VXW87_01265 [Pseudomonadota bacterium]|nr:hypothetical protein [Pseudomonadota bacterium]
MALKDKLNQIGYSIKSIAPNGNEAGDLSQYYSLMYYSANPMLGELLITAMLTAYGFLAVQGLVVSQVSVDSLGSDQVVYVDPEGIAIKDGEKSLMIHKGQNPSSTNLGVEDNTNKPSRP